MSDRADDGAANPFERFGIDPTGGPDEITAVLRARIEAASSEDERRALRQAWEELTFHPRRRLAAALRAHPDSGEAPPAGAPPASPPLPGPSARSLRHLVLAPRVVDAVAPARTRRPVPPDAPVEDDPILRPRARRTGGATL
ncbi:MAG: hypothetical protein ACFCGT_28390 [Sandaracinaceae bacterium]